MKFILLFVFFISSAQLSLAQMWSSSLYPSNWEPGFKDAQGRFLHDFSYAGYRNGEVGIPNVIPGQTYNVVQQFGADPSGKLDSTAAIQAAINTAANAGGGVVFIPAGYYRINGELSITRSGVVIRGAGPGLTKLRFTSSKSGIPHIGFTGKLVHATNITLTQDGLNLSNILRVSNAASLKVGDDIAIGWVITDPFIAEHGMTGIWTIGRNEWKTFFRRKIVAINTSVTPHQITLDIPLRYQAKVRDFASVRKESGYLEGVGVEHLSVSNVTSYVNAWKQNWIYVIQLSGVKNGWVRNITSFSPPEDTTRLYHLQSGGISVGESKNVTVTNCQMEGAQNRGPGGNGYMYELRKSNEILIRDSKGFRGRHNFTQNGDFGSSGLVYLRVESRESRGFQSVMDPVGAPYFSEYHRYLAIGNLVDQSILHDGWLAYNREMESSGAGHTATQSVFWNITNGKILSYQFGIGYVIGTTNTDVSVNPASVLTRYSANTAPNDFSEGIGIGSRLSPASLYEHQLVKRINRMRNFPATQTGTTKNFGN
jgi:hypothetical protein